MEHDKFDRPISESHYHSLPQIPDVLKNQTELLCGLYDDINSLSWFQAHRVPYMLLHEELLMDSLFFSLKLNQMNT